jgi:hypothetical protein
MNYWILFMWQNKEKLFVQSRGIKIFSFFFIFFLIPADLLPVLRLKMESNCACLSGGGTCILVKPGL